MAIYKNGQKLKAFKGDYRPVNIYRGENKITGWHNETKTGQAVSFDGTYNDFADVKVFGKSEQIIMEQGKNLFDKNKIPSKSTNVTTDSLSTGIRVSNSDSYAYRRCAFLCKVQAGMIYALSYTANEISGGQTTKCLMYIVDGSNAFVNIGAIAAMAESSGTGTKSKTFTAPSSGLIWLYFFSSTGVSTPTVNEFTNIQLELGSTATAYEPFIPDSPSPDYPSTVSFIPKDFNLYCNEKNLFGGQLELGYWNVDTGIKAGATSHIRCSDYVTVKENTICTISGFTSGVELFILYYDKDKNYIGSAYKGTLSEATFTTGMNVRYITFYKRQTTDVTQLIQLELGSIATEYKPHVGHTIPINLTAPLYSLPNGVADVVDLNGLETHNLGVKAFDGTENWTAYISKDNHYQLIVGDNMFGLTINPISSSHFISNKVNNSYLSNADYAVMSIDGARIRFKHKDINDVPTWKSFLAAEYAAGHPVTVVYQLATPVTYPLTFPEQVKTFYPYTQIYTDTEATIEVTGKVMD